MSAVRPGFLVAGDHQCRFIGCVGVLVGVVFGLEDNTLAGQPIVVLQRAVTVQADLVSVCIGARCLHQVRIHLLDVVLEAAGQLCRGAAAHINQAAGHRGGTPRLTGGFQHNHVGAGIGGFYRGTETGAATADNQNICLGVPVVYSGKIDSGIGGCEIIHQNTGPLSAVARVVNGMTNATCLEVVRARRYPAHTIIVFFVRWTNVRGTKAYLG